MAGRMRLTRIGKFSLMFLISLILLEVGCGILDNKNDSVVKVVLVNQRQMAGNKIAYWDQTDKNGNKVFPNDYRAHLKWGTVDCRVEFTIKVGAPHIPTPTDTLPWDTCYAQDTSCYLCVNSLVYSVSDTVGIRYALPLDTLVWLAIEQVK